VVLRKQYLLTTLRLICGRKGIHNQFVVFLGLRQLRKAEVLLSDGRWAISLSPPPNQVILPGFAKPEEAEFLRACISEHPNLKKALEADPTDTSDATVVGDLPVALTESLTRRLRTLSEEAITFQRQNAEKLDGLYNHFAHKEKFVCLNFNELVKRAFDQELETLSMGARYAIFAALRKNEGRHTIVRNKSTEVDVFFTPKMLYKQTLQVMTWAREYQDCAARAAIGRDVSAQLRANPLNSFINKARRIILKSRKIRSPTTIGSLGPSSENHIQPDGSVETRSTGEIITPEDHSIIEFMWTTYLRRPAATHNPSALSVGAMILRAVGAYPKLQLNLQIARLFFREMGLMAPWSEEMDNDLRVPAPGRRGAVIAQQLIKQTDNLAHQIGFTSDPFNLPLKDHMAAFRKDWGSIDVYCIDKPSTSILDDGISLEESTDVPGATWFHAHVAHPSAFLHPQGIFAERARTLTSAIYTSAKLYGMLPEDMLHAMSLKPNAPVLTVSSLILENGDIKDVKVSVGVIRKMIRLDPDDVAAVQGIESTETAVLQVGPSIARPRDADMTYYEEAAKHADFIRKLENLVSVRLKKRREEFPDYPKWKVLFQRVRDHVSWAEPYDGSRHTRSYHYLGDPTITLTAPRKSVVQEFHEAFQMDSDLVGQAMVVAGESIGRWLKERDIPAIFRGAVPVSKENSVARLNERAGDIPLNNIVPRKLTSASPIAHVLMGVHQYVRATSPLRRYSDNVAHWQIDAYIKAEAEGRLPASGDLSGLLPFTREEIERHILEGSDTTSMLELLKRKASMHWNMQAIFRAFHFNEAPLPAIWDAQITQPNLQVQMMSNRQQEQPDIADVVAFLQPFSLRTLLLKSKEGWEVGVQRFQFLPVKIEYVDTTFQSVFARAIGPPSWTPTQSGPVHCVKAEHEAKTLA
jgi:hypothetical protein